MKKLLLLLVVIIAAFMQFCSSSKKVQAKAESAKPAVLTYEANVKPLIAAKCSPCHIPPQGRKEPYDNYANVKKDIDDILRRVALNPGERGYMPQKNPKLSDSAVNVLKQWKADGLLEK